MTKGELLKLLEPYDDEQHVCVCVHDDQGHALFQRASLAIQGVVAADPWHRSVPHIIGIQVHARNAVLMPPCPGCGMQMVAPRPGEEAACPTPECRFTVRCLPDGRGWRHDPVWAPEAVKPQAAVEKDHSEISVTLHGGPADGAIVKAPAGIGVIRVPMIKTAELALGWPLRDLGNGIVEALYFLNADGSYSWRAKGRDVPFVNPSVGYWRKQVPDTADPQPDAVVEETPGPSARAAAAWNEMAGKGIVPPILIAAPRGFTGRAGDRLTHGKGVWVWDGSTWAKEVSPDAVVVPDPR